MMSEVAAEKGVSRKIILADGSEWNGMVNRTTDGESLFVTLEDNLSMATVFMAFNDPEKTSRIEMVLEIPTAHFERREEYLGFTKLTDINVQGAEISVRLQIPR